MQRAGQGKRVLGCENTSGPHYDFEEAGCAGVYLLLVYQIARALTLLLPLLLHFRLPLPLRFLPLAPAFEHAAHGGRRVV